MTTLSARTSGLGLGAALLMVAAGIAGCAGQSYSCGTADANHCYGTAAWTGSPTGFSMEQTPVSLTSGDIFVDDEGWLVQEQPNPDDTSWVETGEENEYGEGTVYFWADSTGGTGGFMTYFLGPVTQSAWVAYQVRQDAKVPSQWAVTISDAASGTVLYAEQAVGNPMTPNTVIEGQELAGQQDAQAPLAFFSENEIFHGSAETMTTSNGTVRADRPPNAGWLGTDTPAATNDGGTFFTDCC
jgi:hypothetical protein